MNIKVIIDYENNADTWWSSGGRELWDKYESTRDKYGDLNLDEATALQFMKEAEAIEGWADPEAPAYAPFPLLYQTADGDSVWREDEKLLASDGKKIRDLCTS